MENTCTIDVDRMMELRYFCRQYDDKRRRIKDILLSSSSSFDRAPSSNLKRSVTESKAIKRYLLLQDVQLIEECAKAVEDGAWYKALIEHCCRSVAWEYLGPETLRSSQKAAFFNAKKEFFALLDERQMILYHERLHASEDE